MRKGYNEGHSGSPRKQYVTRLFILRAASDGS